MPALSDKGRKRKNACGILYPELVELSRLDPDRSKPNVGVLGIDPRDHASQEFGLEVLDKLELLLETHLKEIGLLKY